MIVGLRVDYHEPNVVVGGEPITDVAYAVILDALDRTGIVATVVELDDSDDEADTCRSCGRVVAGCAGECGRCYP